MSVVETASRGRIRRETVLNPITALAFFRSGVKEYLLAAEDTYIRIYDVATSTHCGTLPVFRGQPIHGISVPTSVDVNGRHISRADGEARVPQYILVWGGHIVKVLPRRMIEKFASPSTVRDGPSEDKACTSSYTAALAIPEAIAPDWIFTGRVSPFGDRRVVLFTAHNEVIQCRIRPAQPVLELGRVMSPSRPILYSGDLFWTERDCLLVAAGTVFGEILAWRCHLDSLHDDNTRSVEERAGAGADRTEIKETTGCETLAVFTGHEGSIFGVHISTEIITPAGRTIRLLASCSDDRTIRLWQIPERIIEPQSRQTTHDIQSLDARETGFGDNMTNSSMVGVFDKSSKCVAMAMGHISRIWQVELRSSSSLSQAGLLEAYSFGEDATIQKWNLDLTDLESRLRIDASEGNRPPTQLTLQETFSNHSGKHIWSHSTASNSNGLLIATGGADGKISLVESPGNSKVSSGAADEERSSQPSHELQISAQKLMELSRGGTDQATVTSKNSRSKDYIQSFTFMTEKTICVATKMGHVFVGALGDDADIEWKELSLPDGTRQVIGSYSILRRSIRDKTAFLAGTNGELFCYQQSSNSNSIHSLFRAERKITDIFCLSDSLSSSCEDVEILVAPFGGPEIFLLRMDERLQLVSQHKIMVPDGFVATSAAWCYSYLVIGFRNGSISVFEQRPEGLFSLLITSKATKSDRITSILALPRRSETSPCYFLTTARDGRYRIHEITDTGNNTDVQLLHETIPPIAPMIEGSWLSNNADGSQDVMLCGFRSNNFVVWNVTQQVEVQTIDSGNGHRVFDYIPLTDNPQGLRFAFAKASQMRLVSRIRSPHIPLKPGGHGREIKSVSASGRFIATGAEDTTIRLWELNERTGTLRCVLTLEKHATGLQQLKWYGDQYLFSSGGNEQFYAWRITRLESDVCPLGVVCEAVFFDWSEMGDLRIMDFDVGRADNIFGEGDDTRTGETSRDRAEDREMCISMALSNSTVQSYLYSAREGFRLVGRRTYTGACITQLRHLEFTIPSYSQILTAATDGHLAVFTDVISSTDDLSNILVTKLHQSTIKSLDTRRVYTDRGVSYLVFTGGDDNAIGVMHLSTEQPSNAIPAQALIPTATPRIDSPPSRYTVQSKSIVRSAHAAAVTGLAILRLENEDRDAIVVSTSNDQRVKTWRVTDWNSTAATDTDADAPAQLRVQLLDDQYSGVADAGDLEVVEGERGEKRVLVAGVGIEVWR